MKRIITGGLTAGALALSLAVAPSQAIEQPENWKPCRTEDSYHCTFHANLRGNHEGRSFWHRGNGVEHFLSHQRAIRKSKRGFRYFNYSYLGRQGHHGCYAPPSGQAGPVICMDGTRH